MSAHSQLIAGIDAGGTTFKTGIANERGHVLARERIPTTSPGETLSASVASLQRMASEQGAAISALGIASFGPVDIDPASAEYGTILQTPKPGWSGVGLRGAMQSALNVPVYLDTDVNAALLAEMAIGAAKGVARSAYVTLGTGVGVGIIVDGISAGRPFHPELGHIRVERHPEDGSFDGVCAIHGGCLEGLLSAPALIKRFGILEDRTDTDPCWDVPAFYLAQLCLVLNLSFRLEKIVIGGGVSNAGSLLRRTHEHYRDLLGAYLQPEERLADRIIVRAGLGDDAGLMGAIELVRRAR